MSSFPKAVVFDLDGTLIDSAPDIAWCANRKLEEDGFEPYPLEDVRLMIGGGVGKLIERAYRGRGVELERPERNSLTDRMIEIYSGHAAVDTAAYPGAEAALRRFHAVGVPVGLCTNKPHAITTTILKALGWDQYFGAVVGGDSTGGRKPDAAPMLHALETLGVSGEGSVIIGDSKADHGAARNVGARVMLATYGYSKIPVAELEPDWTIDHLDEAFPILCPQPVRV